MPPSDPPVTHAEMREVVELMRDWLPQTAQIIARYVAHCERIEKIAEQEIERLVSK